MHPNSDFSNFLNKSALFDDNEEESPFAQAKFNQSALYENPMMFS